jgi:uncharacterized protein
MPEQVSFPAASAEPTPVMGPTRPRERIEVLDILRGWAIFGMLVVNMSLDLGWAFLFAEQWPGTADRVVVHLVSFFASSKFWTLFSFLFGLGFALQMERSELRGSRFDPLYRRRLFVLLLIGLLCRLLTPFGLILIIYAVLGFLLFLFRARTPRTILGVAFICLLIPLVYHTVDVQMRELRRADPQTAQQVTREDAQRQAEGRARNEQSLRVHSRGSLGEIVTLHAQEFARRHSSLATYLWWLGGQFPLFLLGLYAGRKRILEDIPAHLPFIRKVLWWGLGLGLVGMSVSVVLSPLWHFPPLLTNPAWPYFTHLTGHLFWAVGAPALCFFYVAALVLLTQREAWKHRLAPLAAVGRMALTNYLLQGMIFVLIFYAYGLALYGKVGPLGGVVLAVLIYAVQVPVSVWWMRRFRFGPAEWLWRTLTYGKLQPMRVRQIAA